MNYKLLFANDSIITCMAVAFVINEAGIIRTCSNKATPDATYDSCTNKWCTVKKTTTIE